MSRIAGKPVLIPKEVTVLIQDETVIVSGPKGEERLVIHPSVSVKKFDRQLIFEIKTPDGKAMTGTMRSLVANLIQGVSEGYLKKLELVGVGYRAQSRGKVLNLSLGFSHPISYSVPDGITIETPTQTEIHVRGINSQKVGQAAAEIRSFRPPEPYKGKGVRYSGEEIFRKEAKKK